MEVLVIAVVTYDSEAVLPGCLITLDAPAGMLSFATFDGLSFPVATNLSFVLADCCGALRRLVIAGVAAHGSKL